MPFKIVQTIEHGKNKLTTVPEQWEHNGLLYWPKSVKQEKLRRDEGSVADYSKWSQINCIVKRKNITNFQDAEGEIDIMSNNSETETDTENQTPNKIKRIPNKTFNDMAEEAASTFSISLPLNETQSNHDQCIAPKRIRPVCPDTQKINQDASTSGTEITKSNNLPFIDILNEEDFIFQSVSLQEKLKANENVGTVLTVTEIEADSKLIMQEIKTIKNDIQTVKNDIQTVTENQSILSSNQNTIIAEISKLSIKFEEFIKLSLSTKTNTTLADLAS